MHAAVPKPNLNAITDINSSPLAITIYWDQPCRPCVLARPRASPHFHRSLPPAPASHQYPRTHPVASSSRHHTLRPPHPLCIPLPPSPPLPSPIRWRPCRCYIARPRSRASCLTSLAPPRAHARSSLDSAVYGIQQKFAPILEFVCV